MDPESLKWFAWLAWADAAAIWFGSQLADSQTRPMVFRGILVWFLASQVTRA